MKINDYANNLYSQFGEDGIISKIFEIIKPEFNSCIEFGAWDGIHLSNTASLWKHQNWKAILIESDKERFENLKNTTPANCICLNEFVDSEKNTLDYILEKNNIDKNIDFLSIDIDGNDYHILNSLQLKPKVIAIEYNPTIPYWLNCHGELNSNLGASPTAIENLAKEKGYFLVAATDVNMFFVKKEYSYLFNQFNTNLSDLICKDHYNYIFTDYSGNYIKNHKFVFGINKECNSVIFKSS